MHLNHKPGEIMQVDWAGDTAAVIDTDTGEVIPAYVFVATLPYSGYSYVEAFFSMNQESWTTAHVNVYKYFGGVTRIIQCDNLKTGVQKHGKDEVVLNKSYQELAEHYGTAVLPARVRSPKDKAAVEGTVGIISTFILAALRNRQFLSLPELNEAIWERLETFNHKPFQKRDGSRASSFAEEKPFLRPLPPRPFELATWKMATVGSNYHISVERMNYTHRGQKCVEPGVQHDAVAAVNIILPDGRDGSNLEYHAIVQRNGADLLQRTADRIRCEGQVFQCGVQVHRSPVVQTDDGRHQHTALQNELLFIR